MRHDCPHCVNGLRSTGGSATSSKIPCPYCGGKGYTEDESTVKKAAGEFKSGCSAVIIFAVIGFGVLMLMKILDDVGIGDALRGKSSKETEQRQ
jgi:hypothetical protein